MEAFASEAVILHNAPFVAVKAAINMAAATPVTAGDSSPKWLESHPAIATSAACVVVRRLCFFPLQINARISSK